MAKAELKADQQAYDAAMGRARASETAGRHAEAIGHAVSAWDHLEGMMSYERKYEEGEFTSVPCIDLVLRLAPLTFHAESLDRLSSLLRERRSIDKHASDDLAQRVAEARDRMRAAHRLWNHLERTPDARQDQLRVSLGGSQDDWRSLVEEWITMGVLAREREGGGFRVRLATRLDATVLAGCWGCGAGVTGRKRDFLSEQECTSCKARHIFVVTDGRPRSPVGG